MSPPDPKMCLAEATKDRRYSKWRDEQAKNALELILSTECMFSEGVKNSEQQQYGSIDHASPCVEQPRKLFRRETGSRASDA